MPTKAKVGIHKPKSYISHVILSKPKKYKEVLLVLEWKTLIQKEFDALFANET